MRYKIIAILIVCIFFTLSTLDTPEYVHFIKLDLPQHAIVSNILNMEIISKACNITFDNFISILENSIDSKEYFFPLIMLSDHLSPSVTVYCKSGLKYPNYRSAILIEENAGSEITKLVSISIIRS